LENFKNEKHKGSKAFTGKWKNFDFSVFAKNSNPKTGVDKNHLRK
jgi:hypothetical protein